MDNSLYEQALDIAEAVPKLIRRFFAIETEGPGADLPVAQLRIVSILYSGRQTMSALSSQLGISLSAVTQVADGLNVPGLWKEWLRRRITESSAFSSLRTEARLWRRATTSVCTESSTFSAR